MNIETLFRNWCIENFGYSVEIENADKSLAESFSRDVEDEIQSLRTRVKHFHESHRSQIFPIRGELSGEVSA